METSYFLSVIYFFGRQIFYFLCLTALHTTDNTIVTLLSVEDSQTQKMQNLTTKKWKCRSENCSFPFFPFIFFKIKIYESPL